MPLPTASANANRNEQAPNWDTLARQLSQKWCTNAPMGHYTGKADPVANPQKSWRLYSRILPDHRKPTLNHNAALQNLNPCVYAAGFLMQPFDPNCSEATPWVVPEAQSLPPGNSYALPIRVPPD
jgi:hypothetical protein